MLENFTSFHLRFIFKAKFSKKFRFQHLKLYSWANFLIENKFLRYAGEARLFGFPFALALADFILPLAINMKIPESFCCECFYEAFQLCAFEFLVDVKEIRWAEVWWLFTRFLPLPAHTSCAHFATSHNQFVMKLFCASWNFLVFFLIFTTRVMFWFLFLPFWIYQFREKQGGKSRKLVSLQELS